tara:strand:+ start:2140 stop:2466 length:327 start_codon:yes stop_codon:yes gene_type:complete
MNERQAQHIRSTYNSTPSLRQDQEDLIRSVYSGGRLRGKPLSSCPDRQIYRVADRLYSKAHTFDMPMDDSRQTSAVDAARKHWHEQLRSMFPGEDVPLSELEERILHD